MMTVCLAEFGGAKHEVAIAGPAWRGMAIISVRDGDVNVDGRVVRVLSETNDVDLSWLCKNERRRIRDLARAES